MQILLTLDARAQSRPVGYESAILPEHYFRDYPINLVSLNRCFRQWSPLALGDWLAWLTAEWGIDTHLRVALAHMLLTVFAHFQTSCKSKRRITGR